MDKINKPLNLIGFYSEEMIRQDKKPSFTGRMKTYSVVICVLLIGLTYFIMQRSDIDVTILRSAGMLYQQQPNGYINNIYNADIINKTDSKRQISLITSNPSIKIKYIQTPGILDKEGTSKAVFFLMVPTKEIHLIKTDITIKVMDQNKLLQTINTTFIGPVNGED